MGILVPALFLGTSVISLENEEGGTMLCIFFFLIFIYLAVLGLRYGTGDL